jgi:hypothetical protein
MPDMIARIEAHLQNDDAAARHWECDNLLDEAQAEIERLRGCVMQLSVKNGRMEDEIAELRGIIQQAADDVVAASYPRKMHLEWLEAARKVLAEDDHIASEDCWCKPTELEEGIFVHNSRGRREKHEEGRKLQ